MEGNIKSEEEGPYRQIAELRTESATSNLLGSTIYYLTFYLCSGLSGLSFPFTHGACQSDRENPSKPGNKLA